MIYPNELCTTEPPRRLFTKRSSQCLPVVIETFTSQYGFLAVGGTMRNIRIPGEAPEVKILGELLPDEAMEAPPTPPFLHRPMAPPIAPPMAPPPRPGVGKSRTSMPQIGLCLWSYTSANISKILIVSVRLQMYWLSCECIKLTRGVVSWDW